MCVCNIYFYIQYTYISVQYIYLWCSKHVTEPHHTFLYSPFWQTAVFLQHKHSLFTPSPFFNSPSIITNCKYAATSKPNITIYEGYPENKFHCWYCHCSTVVMKEHVRAEFVDSVARHRHNLQTFSVTHCLVFIMLKKICVVIWKWKISSWHLAGNNLINPLQPRLISKWLSFVPAS